MAESSYVLHVQLASACQEAVGESGEGGSRPARGELQVYKSNSECVCSLGYKEICFLNQKYL